MGLREAKKYIETVRKKQDNPFLWPDFLTGLPDRAAVLKKLDSVYPRIGKHSIAYVRIANIHPFILKYGSQLHAEVIQWAAAILKTAASGRRGSFVGTVGTHDFVVIASTGEIRKILREANNLFKKKMLSLYNSDDRKRGYVISFKRDNGESMEIGFMKLVSALVSSMPEIDRLNLIPAIERFCRGLEETGEDIKEFEKNDQEGEE